MKKKLFAAAMAGFLKVQEACFHLRGGNNYEEKTG